MVKRAAFLAQASTLYSFLFEDIALIERELGPTDAEVPKKRETIAVKPHYQTLLPRLWNRSPTVWVGTQCSVALSAPMFQSMSETKLQKMNFENTLAGAWAGGTQY